MAIHTFFCEKCEDHFEAFVAAKDMPKKKSCPRCGARCKKDFTKMRPNVIQDTLRQPMRLNSLVGRPMVESNTDIKKAMKAHDRSTGSELVMA